MVEVVIEVVVVVVVVVVLEVVVIVVVVVVMAVVVVGHVHSSAPLRQFISPLHKRLLGKQE